MATLGDQDFKKLRKEIRHCRDRIQQFLNDTCGSAENAVENLLDNQSDPDLDEINTLRKCRAKLVVVANSIPDIEELSQPIIQTMECIGANLLIPKMGVAYNTQYFVKLLLPGSPSCFWLKLESTSTDKIEKDLRTTYANTECMKSLPSCGSFVVCLNSGNFYRGKVISPRILEKSLARPKVDVVLVDYGKTVRTSIDKLYPIQSKFCTEPAHGMLCSLYELKPLGANWEMAAIEFFTSQCHNLTATFHQIPERQAAFSTFSADYSVSLLRRDCEEGSSDLRAIMVNQGMARLSVPQGLPGNSSSLQSQDRLDTSNLRLASSTSAADLSEKKTNGKNPSDADQSKIVFKRFLYCYKSKKPNKDHMDRVLRSLPPHQPNTNTADKNLDHSWDKSISFSYWNKDEPKTNVQLALDFLLQNSKYLGITWENKQSCKETLNFFICNKYYDSLVHKYVEFLSETWSDQWLTNIFNEAIKWKNKLYTERLLHLLTILKKLDRCKVLENLSRTVLRFAPDTFEKVYVISFDDDDSSDNFLTPNSLGLTRLHNAIFEKFGANTIRGYLECCSSKDKLIDFLTEDRERLSPLYISAICGKQDVFREMLSFIKEELTAERLLNDSTCDEPLEFLLDAMSDATQLESTEMFKLILNQVKEVLGHDGLLSLLGLRQFSIEDRFDSMIDESSGVLIKVCHNSGCMKTMAEILDNGYKRLNECIFKTNREIYSHFLGRDFDIAEIFGDENLRGLIQAEGGFSSWLKLFFDNPHHFDNNLDMKFCILTKESFLNYLKNNGLLSEFVQTIISPREEEKVNGVKMSYWAQSFSDSNPWFNYKKKDHSALDRLLKFVSEELGQERLKELVTYDQCKLLFNILMINRCGIFQIMLKYLSEENRKEVCAVLFINLLTMPLSLNHTNISIVICFLRCHFDCPTGNAICEILLSNHVCEGGKKRSIWSLFVQSGRNLDDALYLLTKQFKEIKSTTGPKMKDLVLHNDGSGVVIFNAAREKNRAVVDTLLSYLKEESDKNEVREKLINENLMH